MYVLGLNAFHGDAAACLFKDGKLIFAAEEERFLRIKHSAGFPKKSIEYCLAEANIKLQDVDYITINRNPKVRILEKTFYALKNIFKLKKLSDRIKNFNKINFLETQFEDFFKINKHNLSKKIIHIDHHLSHAASSVIPSKFEECNFITVDGFGDFVSTMIGTYKNKNFKILKEVLFPHSLGLFYTSITQFLGFKNYGDEYKVMGLAPYGKPNYLKEFQDIVYFDHKNLFKLNLDYFIHHSKGIEMSWLENEPSIKNVYSSKLMNLLGKERDKNEKISQKYMDIAASAQITYENIFLNIIKLLYKLNPSKNLCISGGCGMNSVANGKILNNTSYKNIYINYAPGDSGGSIGSSIYFLNNKVEFDYKMLRTPYIGNSYNNDTIENLLKNKKEILFKNKIEFKFYENREKLIKKIAEKISDGNIVGFFNGPMEFGPRALGNRSILADPRNNKIRDIINSKIKRREMFRPFAPSILKEAVHDWFEDYDDVPYMSKVYKFKKEKIKFVSAVAHVDGTGRLQTVSKDQNEIYYDLIDNFRKITGVPIILNTSFNENEPIVCNPKEALDCFLRTKMDILVLENFLIYR